MRMRNSNTHSNHLRHADEFDEIEELFGLSNGLSQNQNMMEMYG